MAESMKRGADHLTDRERRFAIERAKDRESSNAEIAKRAGYKGDNNTLKVTACNLMKRAGVRLVIEANRLGKNGKKPKITKKWLMKQARHLILDERVAPSSKLAAMKLLAEMIPGALVPVQVAVSKDTSLEAWVTAMGGRPDDVPAPGKEELQ